ncbi:DUF309 domain-containing protein [Shimia aestuarii]|uniref:DUF309 domain-containing protein n=1 Tax=Shimia aestuarii TaxID=254406 RepID=A0A1I4JQ51_9RHOB|nr:DUF309 domain-containing protein [Shimia aestuarii]SFL68662.1 hypothetical protein SAMN04488042_1011121 [Shimia aestuarii]
MTPPPAWRPPHAYVPGQTPRHADGLFDRFGFDIDDIKGSDRWGLALAFIRDGYFWEAHELLEPIWIALPEESAERRIVQGLIQMANAGLKRRMKRDKAVARLEAIAQDLLAGARGHPGKAILGLNDSEIEALWRSALHRLPQAI